VAHAGSEQVAAWAAYADAPWGRLRSELIRAVLDRHLERPPARVLDAGCGLGELAASYAHAGAEVVAADASEPMLAAARARAGDAAVRWLAADLDETARRLSGGRFDLVLCHNVVGYVADPPAAVAALASLLTERGILSLVVANRAAEPLRLALMKRDLGAALAAAEADRGSRQGETLGVPMGMSDLDETAGWLEAAGLEVVAAAGFRFVNDYLGGDDPLKNTPDGYAAIRDLELALCEREPYRRIGPFLQLLGRSG
jgi:S-adenosylmethionine-dependent methyltransferase